MNRTSARHMVNMRSRPWCKHRAVLTRDLVLTLGALPRLADPDGLALGNRAGTWNGVERNCESALRRAGPLSPISKLERFLSVAFNQLDGAL